MRAFQRILAAGAATVVAATIAAYAGASSLRITAPHPSAASEAAQSSNLRSGLSQSRLLALQLAGKLPAPVPSAVLRRQLQAMNEPRPKLAFHAGGDVGIWAAVTNANYLIGQNANGKKTVTAVDLSANSCFSPVALKVDHTQNVWVGCELTSDSATGGAAQEYSSSGAFVARYVPVCPGNVKNCSTFSGLPWDTGIDPNGNIFASLNLFSIETCQTSCNTTLGGGFMWWSGANPSAQPQLITLTPSCAPVCGVGFMDIDGAGNLWFTFSGYNASNNYGFGLGEVTNPTKKPKFTIVEPIGTYGFFGGAYVSGGGSTLNVIDQEAATVSQYHLPLAPSGTPFNVIGPVPKNVFGVGDPVSGGFNATETKLAIADTDGWLDIGKVTTNKWSLVASPNFFSGLEGAAYSPSDK